MSETLDALEIFLIIAAWLFFAGVAATIAGRKGLSRERFFGLSLVLSPLVGITAAVIAAPDAVRAEGLGIAKKCPHCAELVKFEAVACRFCGRDLPVVVAPAASDSAGDERRRFASREEYETWKKAHPVQSGDGQ